MGRILRLLLVVLGISASIVWADDVRILLQQDGVTIGGTRILNCTGGLNCTMSGGVGQVTVGSGAGGLGPIDRSAGNTSVGNTVTETALYSATVNAGVIGSDYCVRQNVIATLTGDNTNTLTLRAKYGSSVATRTFTPGSVTAEPFLIQVTVCGDGGTSAQQIYMTATAGVAGSVQTARADGTTDSTASQTLSVTAEWGAANPGLTTTKVYAETLVAGGATWLTDPGSNGLLKRNGENTTAVAVAGTDYVVPSGSITGNAATATALAANGANCSAGNAPLGVDASGAVEGCYDVTTQAELNTAVATLQPLHAKLTELSNFVCVDGYAQYVSGTLTCASGATVTDGDKGDITVSSGTWTIDSGVVSNAKLATVATARIKGRVTAGTGAVEDLTGTQVTTLLDTFTHDIKGLVPPPGAVMGKFLKDDGTWGTPSGSGGGGPFIDLDTGTTGGFRDHLNSVIFSVDEATKLVTFYGPLVDAVHGGGPTFITPVAAVGTKKIASIGNDGVPILADDVQPIIVHGPPSAGSCTNANDIFIDDTTTPKAFYFCAGEGTTPIDTASTGDGPTEVCVDQGVCGTFTGASQLDIIAGNSGIVTSRVQSAANHVQVKISGAYLTNATSCTANVTTAVLGQHCTDLDDNHIWTCVLPGAGGASPDFCDTPDEWGINTPPVPTWSAVMAQGHTYGQAVDATSALKVGNDSLSIYKLMWADSNGFHEQVTPAQNFSMLLGTGKNFTFLRNDGTTALWTLTEAGALTGGAALAIDNSGVTSVKPFKSGTAAPGTCAAGEMFFDTDATAGQNVYGCTATNTWTLQGDGGGSGGYAALVQTNGDMILTPQTANGVGSLEVRNLAGSPMVKLGSYNAAGSIGGLYFGSNTGNNFALDGDTSVIRVNAPSSGTGYLTTAGTVAAAWTTATFQISSAGGSKYTWYGAADVALGRSTTGVAEIDNNTAGQYAQLRVGARDSGTNTVVNGLAIHRQSSGTPAAGLGAELLFNVSSSTTADQNAAAIDAVWTTATHASRTADLVVKTVNNAAALAETARFPGPGGLKLATGTKPTCDSTQRGLVYRVDGGAGVADTAEVCDKDAADAYAWRNLKAAGVGDALTTNPLSQFAATTSAQLAGVLSDENGSGKAIFADGTLSIASGKTLTASNTLTFTGTDSSSVAFGTGGTVLYSGGALGTPSSGTLTNASGLPISGITGLGTGVGTWMATPSSANLASAITDETGSGALAFATSPTLTSPSLGSSYLSTSGTAGTGGTTAGLLVKRDSSGNFITATTSDTANVSGIAMATVSATNPVEIARTGTVNCVADNTTTVNNLLGVGTTTAGRCKDLGTADWATIPITTQVLGRALTAVSAGSNVSAHLFGPGHFGSLAVTASSTDTLTNKTLDAEGTGNSITIPVKIALPLVGCAGTTGTLLWDTLATLAPTATCSAGSTNTELMRGTVDFPDSDGDYQIQQAFTLPSDWSGAEDITLYWKAAATSGNVVWQVQTACFADAEAEDAAWNTASTVTDTAKGTTLQLNSASITGITTTGCAAGEFQHIRILRNRTHASDTITGVVSLSAAKLTLRRTM